MSKRQLHILLSCVAILLITIFITACGNPGTATEPPKTEENRAPVISQMLADIQVNVGGKTEITCVAVDPDGDDETYAWSADKGTIAGNGSKAVWTAPETAGVNVVKVVVSDSKGLKTEQSLNILTTVPTATQKPNQPPVIKDFIIYVKGHMPVSLKPDMEIPKVKRYTTAEFECIASDPDGGPIKYIWGATIGKLEGEGSKIQYIATTAEKRVVITVTAVDSNNAKVTAVMNIEVPCCAN